MTVETPKEGALFEGRYYYLSSIVQQSGTYSFALASASTNSALYLSREGGSPAELVLDLGPPPLPPVADFSGAPLSGFASLSVSFTDLSTGAPTSWSWSFGDGGTSTAQHPSHVYTQPGTYTVQLDVAAAGGSDSFTRTDYITVEAPPSPPVADFSGAPLSGLAPLSVAFTDLSTGVLASWSWSFGDGGTSTAQHPSHVYTQAGNYTVQLIVTNPGGSDSFTRIDYVTVEAPPSPPVANFSGTPVSGFAPLNVTFTDLSAGTPTSWSWSFGDGGTSTAQHPTHLYPLPGTYTVQLDVANADGSDSLTRTDYVTVSSVPPVQTFLPVADARVNQASPGTNYGADATLRIRSGNSDAYQSYLRFEPTGLSGPPASAVLRLFVTDASTVGGIVFAASNTWVESTISWSNKPTTLGGPLDVAGNAPLGTWVELDVTAALAGSGPVSFALQSSSTNSCYFSSREGAHPPELVVESGAPAAPVADFSGTPQSGPAPLNVVFSDLSTGAPTSWSWDFGDGGTSTAQHPAHVYVVPGTYTVTLPVANGLGNDSETKVDQVTVGAPSSTQTLLAVADARVREASPNSNYGADVALRVRSSSGDSYQTYLRFNVSGVIGPISSARLRLFVTDGSDDGGRVFPTSGSWGETTITWSNKPAPTGGQIAAAGMVATNAWVEIDVTSAVTAGGFANFVLQSTSSNSCLYQSRESSTNRPELVVTTASP